MQAENRGSEETTEVFRKFYDQSDNCKCFDCGAEAKEFVSVNNACSLCETCAGVHRSFGEHISHVKSRQSPEWTSNELKLLEHGGNAKLKEFFSGYTFEPNAAPIFKYKTLAAFYYRRRLRFAAEGKEHPELPDKERHLEQHENESFFESLTSKLSKVGAMISGIFSSAKTEVEKTDIKEAVEEKAGELKENAKDLASKADDKKEEVRKDLKETKDELKDKLEEKKTEVSDKLEEGADELMEKTGGLREKIHDVKEKAIDLASKGIEAVKDQVSNAAEFIKEKTQGTTAEDVKETLAEKKEEAKEKLESGAEAVQKKTEEVKNNAKDLASKATEKKEEVTKDLKETKEDLKGKLEEKKAEASDKLEEGADELKEKAGGLKEKLLDAKDRAVDLASKGIEAVKGQVSNAAEFIKEKTTGTTAEDVKETLAEKKDEAKEKLESGAEAVQKKTDELKDNAKDIVSKAAEKKEEVSTDLKERKEDLKGKLEEKKTEVSEKLESGAEAVEEKAGGLREKLHDVKEKAMDLASKGIEAVKGQVSTAVEFIKDKTTIPEGEFKDPMTEVEEHRTKGDLSKKSEIKEETDAKLPAKEATDKKTEESEKDAPKGLTATVADLASKGLETVKEQVSNAVDFIKEKAHIETNKEEGDSKEESQARLHSEENKAENRELLDAPKKEAAERERELEVSDVVHKSKEILEHEKEVAEKRAKEEAELQEIANEAAESVKAHVMPSTTKSKADQIREQAAMIEAARGKTRVSKGKGVSKQIVQKGSADPEYIEKLLHAGEEEHDDNEEHEEGEKEHPEVTQAKEKTQETKQTEKKETPVKESQEKRVEPEKKEIKEKPQEETKQQSGEMVCGPNGCSINNKVCTETSTCNTHKKELEAKEKAQAAPQEEKFVDYSGSVWRENSAMTVDNIVHKNSGDVKEPTKTESLGQQVKEKAQAGLETLKEKTRDAAEWVQGKVMPEESKLNLQESKGINANSKLNETDETKKLKENAEEIKENAGSLTENLKGKVHDAAGWVKDKVESLGKTSEQPQQIDEDEQKRIEKRHHDAQELALKEKSAGFDASRPAAMGRMTETDVQRMGDPNAKEHHEHPLQDASPHHKAAYHPKAEYGRLPEPEILRKHSHPEESPSKAGAEEKKEGEFKEKSAPKAQ